MDGDTKSNTTVSSTVFDGGEHYVSTGQSLDSIQVLNGANLYISGGMASNITLTPTTNVSPTSPTTVLNTEQLSTNTTSGYDPSGYEEYYISIYYADTAIYVSDGGIASNIVINGAGYLSDIHIYGQPTTAGWYNGRSTVMYALPAMYVLSGGTAYNTTVYGNQYVSSGGVVNEVIIGDSNAKQYVFDGAVVNSGTISVGNQYVSSGGIVNSMVINSQGNQYIFSDGIASTTIISGGVQYISSGGMATSTVISNGGVQYVSTGGIATSTVINNGGIQSVNTDGSSLVVYIGSDGVQYISGGYISGATVASGGSLYYYGGTLSHLNIESGGTVNGIYYSDDVLIDLYTGSGTIISNITFDGAVHSIVSGQIFDGLQLSNGATLYVSGGSVNNVTLAPTSSSAFDLNTAVLISNSSYNGFSGTQNIEINYIDNYYAGAEVYISAGGVVSNAIVSGPELIYASEVSRVPIYNSINQAAFSQNTYYSLQTQYVLNGGSVYNTVLYGYQYVSSGGLAVNTSIGSSGKEYVLSGGRISGQTLISSGGYLSIENGGIIEGNVALSAGGSITIGISNGGSVDLIGDDNKGLIISGYTPGVNTSVSTEIIGFSGEDTFTVDGLKAENVSSVTYPDDDHITLQLFDGTSLTLNMTGIKQTGYTLGRDANGNITINVCFLSGTMIRMIDGHYAVEDIQVGDTLLTYNAQTKKNVSKKVTWVGKQTAHVNPKLPDDQAGYPVRILKDTFKPGVPKKDLLITPEHCLFIDGHFIPARMLINGRSIYYDYSMTTYEYYHIETEDHSIIWADGMMTESYLNTGNRHLFNHDEKVVTLDRQAKDWEHDSAAPLTVKRSIVEPVFNRLAKRACQQNLLLQNDHNAQLCDDHGLYLLTEEGKKIYHIQVDKDQVTFTLPANTQKIYLVSKVSRPCDVIGPFIDDRRYLGILVGKISVLNEDGSYPMAHYLKEPNLQGWSVVEDGQYRWTMGCALLPLDMYNAENDFELSIQIIAAGPYLVEQEMDEEKNIAV